MKLAKQSLKRLVLPFIAVMAALALIPQLAYASLTPLEGEWQIPCESGLSKEQNFRNESSVTTESFHTDRDCQNLSFEFETTGFLRFPTENPIWIDFIYESVSLRLFNQEIIDDFNQRQVCGVSNWQRATKRNITGLKCALFNTHKESPMAAEGQQKFGIYKLQNDSLYFGEMTQANDGSNPLKRPVQFSQSPYRKHFETF